MLSRIVITQASDLNLPEAIKLFLSLKIQFFTAFFIPLSFALTAFCIKASKVFPIFGLEQSAALGQNGFTHKVCKIILDG